MKLGTGVIRVGLNINELFFAIIDLDLLLALEKLKLIIATTGHCF